MLRWIEKWRNRRTENWREQFREIEAEQRGLEMRYSRERMLEECIGSLMSGSPMSLLAHRLLARTIIERAEEFRLVRRDDVIQYELQISSGDWLQGVQIPVGAQRQLFICFRHLGNIDLFLRGATLKGYGTFTYEGEEYSLSLLFEPTDDGDEILNARVQRLPAKDPQISKT